jgi:glycosyltransferase involved in cell wall biosynthesis
MNQVVGIVQTGRHGRDSLDPRVWSSSSRFFFTGMKRHNLLHRMIGIEVPTWLRHVYVLKNIHRVRKTWRRQFIMDPAYRRALTRQFAGCLQPTDRGHDFLQVGAMFNAREVVGDGARCFSYHDSNMVEGLSSPYAPNKISARRVERGLAYERQVYHSMDRVFTMSEHLRRSMIRNFDVPEDRVVSIGAGINLDSIPEDVPDKSYTGQEVLFIGIDFPRKGGWELLKAFRAVRDRVPAALLHLVGPDSLKIPPRLEGGVVFHGFLNKNHPDGRAKLAELFRRSCLFVMPSLYEPFGIAPLEAMVHRVPALVTNASALLETVTPGETGDLVACGDVDGLRRKLIDLLSDPVALRRMGAKGREMVLQRYTWGSFVERAIQAMAGPVQPGKPCREDAGPDPPNNGGVRRQAAE